MNQPNNLKIAWPIWAIIIILIVIIYLITIGQVDVAAAEEEGESRQEKKKRIEEEHQLLSEVLANNKSMKSRLERKFQRMYLGVRILLVGIYVLLNVGMVLTFGLSSSQLLEVNSFIILGFAFWGFLAFGFPRDFKYYLQYLKNAIENRVYKNYLNLDSEIAENEKALTKLIQERNMIDQLKE